jgi:L-lactate utilization protein LutC
VDTAHRAVKEAPRLQFSTLATADQIRKTMDALQGHGIAAELVDTRELALARVQSLIPAGASVNTGASLTLKEIGFEALLISNNHPWRNLKGEVVAEKDPVKQAFLRKQGVLADYFLGSVHAVSQTGELVIASLTGSQLGPYAFTSSHVIWIVGTQKITPTLEDGIRRVREYVLPHEDRRMRESSGGRMGSGIGKLLIIQQEAAFLNRTLTLIFINQPVGD